MIKLDTCTKCGATVKPSAMGDHWIIAGHIASKNSRAVRVTFVKLGERNS